MYRNLAINLVVYIWNIRLKYKFWLNFGLNQPFCLKQKLLKTM